MNIYRNIKNKLCFVEIFITWCAWMMFGLLSGYLPGWRGGYSLGRYFELQKRLGEIPYAAIVALRKKQERTTISSCSDLERGKLETLSQEELLFYAFMVNGKVRLGLRAFMAILLLCVAIFLGADWLVLHALIAILFFFGILRVAQGSMEIL